MAHVVSLQELVLEYFLQVGGLVEPPVYGVYEALLPDEVAARWGVEPIQFLRFDQAQDAAPAGQVITLQYNHPLVDMIVSEVRQQTANAMFYVNNVRLEKPALFSVIEKSINLPNARLFPLKTAVERQRMYHLVQFNFKVSLVADEKRELIASIWLNLQGGQRVDNPEADHLAILDLENNFPHMPLADPYFLTGETNPLSEKVLLALYERSRPAAVLELAPVLASSKKRLERFLELDRARLLEYYDDLAKNVQKRLRSAETERQPALQAKLDAIQSERQAKLADIEEKYHLRVELEPLNLAVVAQPKVDLLVEIKKRTQSVQRRVVWDPLRHKVEPLICDVCGQSGDSLLLCEEGHLAHAECLQPQCVECKRVYCQKCSEKSQTCVVCARPVCSHSLVKCSVCQRITCHDHLNVCHAAPAPPLRTAARVPDPALEKTGGAEKKTQKAKVSATPAKKQPARSAPKALPGAGGYMEIYSDPSDSSITAYVIVRKKEIAVRHWTMTNKGLRSICQCEKGSKCTCDRVLYRPALEEELNDQVDWLIEKMRAEYGVSSTKIRYFQIRQNEPHQEVKLKIPPAWRNLQALAEARQGFEQLK